MARAVPPSIRRHSLGALLVALVGCRSAPRLVREDTHEVAAPIASRVACAPCHEAIVREWEGSPHRRAFSDPWFQAGYRVDHRAFCRDCHAPLHEGVDPPTGTLAYEEGISCASCHESARLHPSEAPRADFTTRVCAVCHEFDFPDEGHHARFDPSEQMQRTQTEWRESGVTETCNDCHMGPTHRSHAFAILDAPERIAAAIVVEGTLTHRGESTEVEMHLSARGAGHAVPTGDIFRALELVVWTDTSPPQRRLLMRRFGTRLAFDRGSGFSARLGEIEDARIPPTGSRVERFALSGRVEQVRYRLDFLRVNPAQAAVQHIADIDNRARLLEGTLTSR